MDCKAKILINSKNKSTKRYEQDSIVISENINDSEFLDLDKAVDMITALDLKTREELFTYITNSNVKTLTENDLTKEKIFTTGNMTLASLLNRFPTLKEMLGEEIRNYNEYNILFTNSFSLNDVNYSGRVIMSNGKEIFIIKDFYGAKKFIKYLKAQKIIKDSFKPNEPFPAVLEPLKKDLELIASRFNTNVPKLLNEFLNNRESFKTFTKNGEIIVPRKVLSKAIYTLTEDFEYNDVYTELEGGIYDLSENTSGFDWEITSDNLYDVLNAVYPNIFNMSKDDFKNLTAEQLNAIFYGENGIFRGHPKLERSSIKDIYVENQSATIETEKEVTDSFTQKDLSDNWETIRTAGKNANLEIPKSFNAAKNKENFKKWIENAEGVEILGKDNELHPLKIEEKENGKYTFPYTYIKKTTSKNKEFKPSTITFTFPFTTIGNTYNFGYDTKYIFSPVNNEMIKDGIYKGMYIYKAVIRNVQEGKDREVYAISRSIISPNSYMKTYSSLESALAGIESKNNEDIIIENSNFSIRKSVSAPRESLIEMKSAQQGQILTVSNYKLPDNFKYSILDTHKKTLLEMSLGEFKEIFADSPEIQRLETPEDVFSFIVSVPASGIGFEDYVKSIKTASEAKEIIDEILSAGKSSYFIEKLISFTDKKTKIKKKSGTLRLLKSDGNSLNIEGTNVGEVEINTFLRSNMESVAKDFKENYGIEVLAFSADELEQYVKDNNLGISESEIKIVKAFVHDGQIILNTSNSDISDLFHEISHLFLGALKVKDFKAYEQILENFSKDSRFDKKFEYKKKVYENLARIDLIEETVVELLAEKLIKQDSLVNDYIPGKFMDFMYKVINDVHKIANNPDEENSMGFDSYMKNLLNETKDESKKRRAITNFIADKIAENSIIENCD